MVANLYYQLPSWWNQIILLSYATYAGPETYFLQSFQIWLHCDRNDDFCSCIFVLSPKRTAILLNTARQKWETASSQIGWIMTNMTPKYSGIRLLTPLWRAGHPEARPSDEYEVLLTCSEWPSQKKNLFSAVFPRLPEGFRLTRTWRFQLLLVPLR